MYRKTLELKIKMLGVKYPDTFTSINNLTVIF